MPRVSSAPQWSLTGSVRPAGDTVKISLELIDPSDGTAIWSQQYTREVKDIFAVQAQVAGEVAQALRVTLQPTPSSARAASRLVDPRAYELYLRGRQAAAERHLPEAIDFYERAIAADGGLGEAFAGVADALALEVAFNGAADDAVRRGRVQTAAKRAYELDPDLPQANLAMALTSEPLGDALKYFRRAIELDPSVRGGVSHRRRCNLATSIPSWRSRFCARRSRSIRGSRSFMPTSPVRSARWAETRSSKSS